MVVVILASDMVRQRSRKESEDSLISKVYLSVCFLSTDEGVIPETSRFLLY